MTDKKEKKIIRGVDTDEPWFEGECNKCGSKIVHNEYVPNFCFDCLEKLEDSEEIDLYL